MTIAAWLPILDVWESIEVGFVALATLTFLVATVASAVPSPRLAVAFVAIVVVLVCILMIGTAAADLLGAFLRYRGSP